MLKATGYSGKSTKQSVDTISVCVILKYLILTRGPSLETMQLFETSLAAICDKRELCELSCLLEEVLAILRGSPGRERTAVP